METVIACGIEVKNAEGLYKGQVRITLVVPATRRDTPGNPCVTGNPGIVLTTAHAYWSWRVVPSKELLAFTHDVGRRYKDGDVTIERAASDVFNRQPHLTRLTFIHEDYAIVVSDALADAFCKGVHTLIAATCPTCTSPLFIGEECGLCGWKP